MLKSSHERVAVTGMGVVAPNGIGWQSFWRALLAGESGIRPVEHLDLSECSTNLGGEVRDFVPSEFMSAGRVAASGRTTQLGIAAVRLALQDAALSPNHLDPLTSQLVLGTTMGEMESRFQLTKQWLSGGRGPLPCKQWSEFSDFLMPHHIADELGASLNGSLIPTACSAGNYAIGYGFDLIRSGRADVVIAGGTDALCSGAYAGFGRMFALAPEKCQPFDRNRKGLVIAEGAGMLVLESWSHACQRRAPVYAELRGYGLACGAHHMTTPYAGGMEAAMAEALASAGVAPQDVGLISAHGTGTPANDTVESTAIRDVFQDCSAPPPVHAIKSMIGHTMGAASALEAIACVLAIREGRIPPTINYETPDEECPVDCIPNQMRECDVGIALNNGFAFGNNEAVAVFGRCPSEANA